MILDARKVPKGEALSCDICIIGAGAAGITLALEFANTSTDLILIEAGDISKSGESQQLYQGTISDPSRHVPLDTDRLRRLGGTTATWGGRCIPFDDIDFAQREYVPYSGWPISRKDLCLYYQRAHEYCQCGDFTYLQQEALPDAAPDMVSGFEDGDLVTSTIERWSPPTHFGKAYLARLKSARNIRVLVNAICLNIGLTREGNRVSHLTISSFRRNDFQIQPRIAVLAGGALEVTRLLLASNQEHKSGIGNHSGWLGRSYMCHLNGVISRVTFDSARNVVFGYEVDSRGVYCRRRFWINEKTQRAMRILNMYALLDRPLIGDPAHGNPVLSLAFLAKRLARRRQNEPLGKRRSGIYWAHVRNIIAGSPEVMSFLPRFGRARFLQSRRIPSLLVKPRSNTYHLYYQAEQAPNPASHVRLSADRDPFGVPRLHLDYRISEIDIESVYRAHQLINRELRRQRCGFLTFEREDPREHISKNRVVVGHHIGTTRMAKASSQGVVDENCRIHGLTNLFIASSAVFPTSSQANPTLTIVAMAIRLADRLRSAYLALMTVQLLFTL